VADDPKPPKAPKKPPSLDRRLREAQKEVALAEAQYTADLLQQLRGTERRLMEANVVYGEVDDAAWTPIAGGGMNTSQKTLTEARDAQTVRRQMYRFWRFDPHGRGILRNFVRFIIGTQFGVDFDEQRLGKWNKDKTRLELTKAEDEQPIVRVLWNDFVERSRFMQRAKEMVLRTFRDGECFVRKFERKGRIALRFIEPEHVVNPVAGGIQMGEVQAGDIDGDEFVGEKTRIQDGIEYLHDDRETLVAIHVKVRIDGFSMEGAPERIPASQVLHMKAFCDMNDLRGIPMLEVVAKQLVNYAAWEEYRLILNKMRSAVALVRKVEGTSAQAQAIIQGRQSPREDPRRLTPQTGTGNREAMFRAGTTLTPSAGVSYEFISPNLQARDAAEDGRRFLLTIAAGTGLPEMLITGDWSNSNFASSVEARTPSVREWEDWQEFFEEHFKRIIGWVLTAAKQSGAEGLGLPEDVEETVTLQWPAVVAKDVFRDTERYMNLWSSGLLSKRTWSALEDLDYDAEQENLSEEGKTDAATPLDVQSLPSNPSERRARGSYGPEGPPQNGNGTSQERQPPDRQNADQRAPAREDRPRQEAYVSYQQALAQLHEDLDDLTDPNLRAAVDRYIESASAVLVMHGRGTTTANGHRRTTPPHRRPRRGR
jgi:lambda family portal protein